MLRVAASCLLAVWALHLSAGRADAAVVVPTSDDEVIEVLPAAAGPRAELRALRQALAANPRDAASAVALSRRYLAQARAQGDPRFAGQALAVLAAWPDAARAPDEVLLMTATLQQHLHAFDASVSILERLVERQPHHSQAWLTLATLHRVQGRYEASDRACGALALAGNRLYAHACKAENDSLRGDFTGAHSALNAMLANEQLAPSTRQWLLTTLAESEARSGRPVRAERSYREALQAGDDGYTTLSYVDFLLHERRFAEASRALQGQPRTDAVVLRLAIAGLQSASTRAREDVRDMRERIAAANLRPQAKSTHAREQAMFALWVERQPRIALELARENVRHQREPLDLLVLAHAAAASRDDTAVREVRALANEMRLRDARLDAALR